MRIHSMLLVKNEVDIIEACLRSASKWSDFIYVYDGASTDGTWETVLRLSSDKIIPFKQDGKPFKEGLRAEIYNSVSNNCRPGDWWCQLNADEVYIDNPREFLLTVKPSHHVVWGVFVQYYLTNEDVTNLDFSAPCENLLANVRYYKANCSERRFFRFRPRLRWSEDDAWPRRLGLTDPRLIRFRHYPYRSPQPIQTRLDVRQDNRARGFEGWSTVAKAATWRDKLSSTEDLEYDWQDGNYVIQTKSLPDHVGTRFHRVVQCAMQSLRIWP